MNSSPDVETPILPAVHVRKTAHMLEIEDRFGGEDIRSLFVRYIDTEPRIRDVADRLGILPATCSRWIADLGLQHYARQQRIAKKLAS